MLAHSGDVNDNGERMGPMMEVSKRDYERLAAMRYLLRRFLRFSDAAARAAGLTPQQHQALLAIKGFPGRDSVTVGELAERLQIVHHAAVGLVQRMVDARLLRKQPSLADKRQVWLAVTPRGERLLEDLTHAHRAELARIGESLVRLIRSAEELD